MYPGHQCSPFMNCGNNRIEEKKSLHLFWNDFTLFVIHIHCHHHHNRKLVINMCF